MATTATHEPILASWTIQQVIREYPQLLDVLIETAPAFSKLRNPLMRKVQARLVTVEQAARIAGIEPAILTQRLNHIAGNAPLDPAVDLPTPVQSAESPPPWVAAAPVVAELDVRPLIARGEEPFHPIMKTAREVPVGSTFRLMVGFEPLPLYDALAKQGFGHFATQTGPDWTVLFYRLPGGAAPVNAAREQSASPKVDWNAAASAEVTIDVRELVPPEPMIKILQALETLPPGQSLLVHHVRRPIHLYDRLNEMGYAHDTRELEPGQVEVLIQKPAPESHS